MSLLPIRFNCQRGCFQRTRVTAQKFILVDWQGLETVYLNCVEVRRLISCGFPWFINAPALDTEQSVLPLSVCNACLGIAPFCTVCKVAKHNVSFKRDKYTNINIRSKGEAGRCPVNKKIWWKDVSCQIFSGHSSGWWFEQHKWAQVKSALGTGKGSCLVICTGEKEEVHRAVLVRHSKALQH